MSARFWSEERLQELQHLWHDGKQESEIALHFGKTVKAVHAARRHYGLIEARASRTHLAHRMPARATLKVLLLEPAPGWPTRAELMGSNARLARVK